MQETVDHRAFMAALPGAVKAQLTRIDDRASALHLLVHLAAIALTGALIALQIPFWPVLLLLQGVLIIALFTVEHECTHKSTFTSTIWNDWIGRFCGVLILLPFEWFRYFHMAHHRYTNDPVKDPELMYGERPNSWVTYLIHLSGYGYWTGMARVLFANGLGRANEGFIPKPAIQRIRREARGMMAIYFAVIASLFVTPVLLWAWIVPALIGQPFLRMFLLAEHGQCPPVANMFENTRTTFTSSLVRYLTWNASYHVEHHTFPSVPGHNLPALHTHMKDQLQVTSPGYRQFISNYPDKFS